MFLHNHGKLGCPICRSTYNLSRDILVSNLEKTCQREGDNIMDAKVCLAAQYYCQGRYYKSRKLLESLGDKIQNYKGGYYYLALLYRYGLGGKKKSQEAFNIFLKISEVGRSLQMLGEMFIEGEGVAKNREYGMSLIRIDEKKISLPIHYRTGKNVIF